MNFEAVFQPGGQSLSAFYASVLYRRSRNQRLVAGVCQIIVGLLLFATETAVQVMKYTGGVVGSGFWCGPFIVASGAYGIRAHLSQTPNAKLNSYIAGVLSICPFSVLTILIGALGLYQDLMDNWLTPGLVANGLKMAEGLASIVCGAAIISRIGRKKDVDLIAEYRENLAAKTIEAAEIVSKTLRRDRTITVGTVASRNSVDSLCDEQRFPPNFSREIQQQQRQEEDFKMEIFLQETIPEKYDESVRTDSSIVEVDVRVEVCTVENETETEALSDKEYEDSV